MIFKQIEIFYEFYPKRVYESHFFWYTIGGNGEME